MRLPIKFLKSNLDSPVRGVCYGRPIQPEGGMPYSIMRIAEIPDFDLEFAGLMLRCNDISIEVLVVLVRPLAPLSHPTVEFETESKRVQFTANVVTPGALLLLPPEAAALAAGPWQESPKLSITVEDESGADIRRYQFDWPYKRIASAAGELPDTLTKATPKGRARVWSTV